MAPHLFSDNSVLHPPGPVKFSQSDKSVNCRYFLRNGASPQGIFPLCLRKKATCPPPWAAGRQAPAKARTAFVFLSKGAATQAGREPQRKLNGMPFFRWRSSAPSGKNPVEPCHAAFGGLLSAKLSRQTKTRGVPCRVAHSRHGTPLFPVWPKGRLCTFLATWMPDGQERTSIPDKTLRSGWGGLTNLSRARPFSSPLPLKWRRKV